MVQRWSIVKRSNGSKLAGEHTRILSTRRDQQWLFFGHVERCYNKLVHVYHNGNAWGQRCCESWYRRGKLWRQRYLFYYARSRIYHFGCSGGWHFTGSYFHLHL